MSHIESLFLSIIENIDALRDYQKYDALSLLIKATGEAGIRNKYHSVLSDIFPKLPDIDELDDIFKLTSFSDLIKTIEGTEFENESAFKGWKERNNYIITVTNNHKELKKR